MILDSGLLFLGHPVYILNCLVVTYVVRLLMFARMFLCNYNAFLSIESVCWSIKYM